MADYPIIAPVSEASFLQTPQEELKDCQSDFTSVFGTFDNSFLKGITLSHSEENNETPFAYDAVMGNIFNDTPEEAYTYEDYDDDEIVSTLGFEC